MPRHVGLVHGEDLLDAIAELPSGWRQPEGPFRRRLSGYGQQLGPHSQQQQQQHHHQQLRQQLGAQPSRGSAAPASLQLPTEAIQSGAQAAWSEGPGLPGAVAAVLREEPETRYLGHPRAGLQRHQHRRGWLRPHVLWQGLQDAGVSGVRKVRLHLPLVLRGQVPSVQDEKNSTHMSVEGLRLRLVSRAS